MSYILDALRKAETERALTRVSCIASPPKDKTTRRDPTWRWSLIALVMICTAVLIWWASQDSAPESSVIFQGGRVLNHAETPGSNSESGRVLVPTLTMAIQPVSQQPLLASRDPSVEHATKPPVSVIGVSSGKDDTIRKVDTVSSNISPLPINEPVIDDKMARIAQEAEEGRQGPGTDKSGTESDFVKDEAVVTDTKQDVPTDEPLPPLLSTLPYRFQTTLPKIEINAQAYTEDAEARFVIINMKKYREGDHTEAGILVESIGESYLVLSYQGQVFRLQR